ncbi:hypothetical protein MMC26_004753 [Xylographa opegraphella]|nr:hypothetical protein [Xylographa opegraphella]
MKNSDYELTYEVEIEFVLVFHEKLILAQLEHEAGRPTICNTDFRVTEAQIIAVLKKNLTPELRMQLNPVPQVYRHSRPRYLAWGLRVGAEETRERTAATYATDGKLRTYKREHLHMAREILRSADQSKHLQYWDAALPSDITVDVCLDKPTTFENWHLIKELIIEALTLTELEHYLVTYKRCFQRDGPTSGQHNKRSLSPETSGAGGSALKKQKLPPSPSSMSSSFQSNDTDQENRPPHSTSALSARRNASMSSSFQSNDTDRENRPPNSTGAFRVRSNFSMSSSFQSNDTDQENRPPNSTGAISIRSNASMSSSSQANDSNQETTLSQDPFEKGPNRFSHSLLDFPLGPDLLVQDQSVDVDPTESFEAVMRLLQPIDKPKHGRWERPNPGHHSLSSSKGDLPYIGNTKYDFYGIVEFYDPNIRGRDPENRTLDDLLKWGDERLDREGRCFKSLFPLPEGNGPHSSGPMPGVDEATFVAFNTRQDLRSQLLRLLDRIWQFYGFQRVEHGSVERIADYSHAIQRFQSKWQDYHARATRIIRCLRVLGLPREAFYFYYTLARVTVIGQEARKIWLEAAVGPLYLKPSTFFGGISTLNLRETHPFLRPDYSISPTVPANSPAAGPSNTPILLGWKQTTTSATSGQPNTTAPVAQTSFITVTTPDRTTSSRPPRTVDETVKLSAVTAGRVISPEPPARLPQTSEWDSQGAVLVSRAFTLTRDDTGFPEINDLCNRLKGQPCHLHGATAGPKTGLHIRMKHTHEDIDQKTLQNLLYILVMYEKQINTIMPHHRRTNSTSDTAQNELRSNYINIHYPDDHASPPDQAYPATERPLEDVRASIFDGDGSLLSGLIFLSGGDKERAVNFTDLEDEPGKPVRPHTIEFRQHESVLSGEMIQHWVRFCAGLLRLANHHAHFQALQMPDTSPDTATHDDPVWRHLTARQIADRLGTGTPLMRTDRLPDLRARGFPFAEWDDSMSVFDLIEEMELDDETTRYFHRRAAFFARQDMELPIVTPLFVPSTDPATPVRPGSAQQPSSVGSSEASTTILEHILLSPTLTRRLLATNVRPGAMYHS